MSSSISIALILVIVGALVLLWGRRVFFLTAGVGALLGVGFLNLIPGQQNGALALLIIFGLAIAGGVAGFFVKSLGKLLGMGIGFLAGGAITLGILGVLGIDLGIFQFLLALVGGLAGLVLVNRFFDWAIIILACLTGALLVARGLELLTGEFSGAIGTLIWIVLAVLGFVNLSRR
ncbi:MAG: hypothetical protein P8Z00_17525 [Anaerolineales bacterium]